MLRTTPDLLISLSGIARLAQVKRPVVSVWRSRSRGTVHPFPAAHRADGGRERFDAIEVAEWLLATGRGNNADPLGDAAAYALADGADPASERSFDALTSLLALRAASGNSLTGMPLRDIEDLADEVDPDDTMLLSEIEGMGERGHPLAHFVDVLVDGAYSPAAAFENLVAERARSGGRKRGVAMLADQAVALVVGAGLELAAGVPGSDSVRPQFNDPSGANSELFTALVRAAPEHAELGLAVAGNHAEARFARRRLSAHGTPAGVEAPGGPHVHLAHFIDGAAATLDEIERIAESMSDAQRAVIIAPAAVLCEGDLDARATESRSEILRLGRVRAIVRLPDGLLPAHPRQALALWVLGPAHESIPLAERWTMVADLTALELDDSIRFDLISDLAAAMGDRHTVNAHSFRFAKLAYTSSLLARSGSYFAPPTTVKYGQMDAVPDASLAARLDAVIAQLGADSPLAGDRIVPLEKAAFLEASPLGVLMHEGHLRCFSGARLNPDHFSTSRGFRIIGPDDVEPDELPGATARASGTRTIDRLLLAASYPAARLTEPGDVVFVTSPTPRAIVDREGAAVVSYPARILRINASDPAGLVPDVLAFDLNAHRARDWRATVVRRVLPREQVALTVALAEIHSAQDALRKRLAQLDELGALTISGVASGTISLTPTPKGTT